MTAVWLKPMPKKRWIKTPIVNYEFQLQFENRKCGLLLDSRGGGKLDNSLIRGNFYLTIN